MSHALGPETVARSVVFAVTLAALFVGHALGDHIAQTDHQADDKSQPGRVGYRALAGHLLTYHVTAGAVLALTALALRLPLSAVGLAAGLGFSVLTHGFLDRRWPVRAIMRATRSPRFAEATSPICGMYVADQALHQGALLISALLIAGL